MIVSPSKVRVVALVVAADCRKAAGFKRVSREFILAIEAAARAAVVDRVKRHPSKGVTLK